MSSDSTIKGWENVNLKDTEAVLRHALDLYHPHMSLASSFGLEDVVLIDMLARIRQDVRIFSLDTGRLNSETYECAESIREKYGVTIEWQFPEREAVETLEREKGLFSFKESIPNRKECCNIRKVIPLQRAIGGLQAWITGQRREQSVTRSELHVVETDQSHGGMMKLNPLADWTLDDIWMYINKNEVPYNKLHDQGYPSIGCASCTRAIEPGEDQRAGRWWWENPEHKECGLHIDLSKGAGI